VDLSIGPSDGDGAATLSRYVAWEFEDYDPA